MIEYVNEAGEVTMGTNFGESYDKEWALQDQGRREGIEEGEEKKTKEIALKLLEDNQDEQYVSKITGLTIEEIKKLVEE